MSKPKNQRYTISCDFDGVLHSYTSPWVNAHTIPDPPVEGAIEWLADALQSFDVVIHTTRAKTWRGRVAVRRWLMQHGWGYWHGSTMDEPSPHAHGLRKVRVTHKKPAALVYIDDRAWRFEGRFPTRDEVHAARPWNKPK